MALVIIGVVAITTRSASALEPDAAQACKNFFSAVSAQKYTDAWGLLSSTSQQLLVKTVADTGKISTEASQKLFATADPAVTQSFWTPLRSNATNIAQGSFTVEKVEGDNALVAIDKVPSAAQTIRFFMVKEASGWKLGLMETIVAAHEAQLKQQQQQQPIGPAGEQPAKNSSTDQNQQNQQTKDQPASSEAPKE
jgi:hypothetical protein